MKKNILLFIIFFSLHTKILQASTAHKIEKIGDIVQIIIPTVAIGMALNEKEYYNLFKMSANILFTQLIVESLKRLTQVERPNYVNGDKKHSFPSGHTAAAFSGAAFIHFNYSYKKALPFYGLASFVAFSRVYNNKHSIVDVTAGATIAVIFSYLLAQKIFPKQNVQVAFDSNFKNNFHLYVNYNY